MGFVSDTFQLYVVLASRKPVTGCGNENLQSQYLFQSWEQDQAFKTSLGYIKPYLS